MKIRYQCQNRGRNNCCCPQQLKQHTEHKKIHPRRDLELGSCSQGIANWAPPHGGQWGTGGQEDKEAALGLSPPAQSRSDRGQPTPAETGQAHFSGTDISDRGGNFSSEGNSQMTTETKHEPEST